EAEQPVDVELHVGTDVAPDEERPERDARRADLVLCQGGCPCIWRLCDGPYAPIARGRRVEAPEEVVAEAEAMAVRVAAIAEPAWHAAPGPEPGQPLRDGGGQCVVVAAELMEEEQRLRRRDDAALPASFRVLDLGEASDD